VNDTARVLLAAAVLSGLALPTFVWRVTQVDPEDTGRLIGELRLAQWAAVLLSGISGIPIGLAIAGTTPIAHVDAAFSVVFIGLAGIVLQREPREALLLASAAFVCHALLDLAHRPGWLSPELSPRWFSTGCAMYNVYLAGLCYWARRR
jgi:hypothetical protein